MHNWYKYILSDQCVLDFQESIDREFSDHARSMGGYEPDSAYDLKEAFFEKYLWNFQLGRMMFYHHFLSQYLPINIDVLSIGSGRCANELRLMEDGPYNITCSDLARGPAHEQTLRLFPNLKWESFDILSDPHSNSFDAVICLSVIYLFDDNQLSRFFNHAAASLKSCGHLILDSAGSPDNFLSWFVHDVLLKSEVHLIRLKRFFTKGKWQAIVKKHMGYRRNDDELISAAHKAGFKLIVQKNGGYLTDFRRSTLVSKVLARTSIFNSSLSRLGQRIPYIRMFQFQKSY